MISRPLPPFSRRTASPGSFDAFVTKINAAGSALVYSTYLGGNASEFSLDGGAIAVDSDGNAYVGGHDSLEQFPRREHEHDPAGLRWRRKKRRLCRQVQRRGQRAPLQHLPGWHDR